MYRLTEEITFPHPDYADADGLLAIGGDLSLDRLLLAYQYGIFPWFNADEPPLWWAPDPRWVIFPSQVYVSKTMRQVFDRQYFRISYDQCFEQVIGACAAAPRAGQAGTWLLPAVQKAYLGLHRLGLAHSVEVWQGDALVGGLYGVSLGRVFYGESMFSHVSNASKAALIQLARSLQARDFWLIDCQVHTTHLESMGAVSISRRQFLDYLDRNPLGQTLRGGWGDWAK